MSTQSIPTRVKVSSEKVAEIVFEKVFPAIHGEQMDAVVMSLICAAILAMVPDITQERLQETILETSGFMINMLANGNDVVAGEAN